MMSRVRLSPRAEADIDAIWRYIANDSPANADRFLPRLLDACRTTLATFPESGRRRDELANGLRSFPVGNYVIYYRALDGGVEVVRILHAARDVHSVFD